MLVVLFLVFFSRVNQILSADCFVKTRFEKNWGLPIRKIRAADLNQRKFKFRMLLEPLI